MRMQRSEQERVEAIEREYLERLERERAAPVAATKMTDAPPLPLLIDPNGDADMASG